MRPRGARACIVLVSCLTALAALIPPASAGVIDGPHPSDPTPGGFSPATSGADWPQFHSSSERVGVNSYEGAINTTSAASMTLKWSFDAHDDVWSSPAVADGVVYAGSDKDKLYAIDAETGKKVWSYKTDGNVRSSPAVVGGVVYVGSDDDKVYALDAATGEKIWSYTTGGDIRQSSPLVSGGMVYVGSLDHSMYALDADTGSKVWSYKTTAPIRGSAAVSGTTLYFGSDNSVLYAVDANTGALTWSTTLGGRIRNTPSVADGVVYVGADDYKVYAFDAATGTLKWTTVTLPNLGIVRSTPTVYDGKVYVDTGETSPMGSHFYVFDATTGVEICDHSMADYATSSVAIANGVAFVGSFSFQLYAFDASDCTKLWDSGFTLMQGGIKSSPAISDGSVYVGSLDGNVYAFEPTTGAVLGSAVTLTDDAYDPSEVTGHDLGKSVQWTNEGSSTHDVTDSSGMDLYGSGPLGPNDSYTFTFVAAGIYKYACSLHPDMTGTIKAPMILTPDTGNASTPFTLTWASTAAPAGYTYDVQIERPGDSDWTTWLSGVTYGSTTFVPDAGNGTYSFRAHIRKLAGGAAASYSASQSITVG